MELYFRGIFAFVVVLCNSCVSGIRFGPDYDKETCQSIENGTFKPTNKTLTKSQFKDLFPSDGECGKAEPVLERVFGGNDTLLGEHPWNVALFYKSYGNLVYKCGGVILTQRWVLTAAHCVHGRLADQLKKVRVGEHDFRTPKDCTSLPNAKIKKICTNFTDHDVEKIIENEYFATCEPGTSTSLIHDIALLRTKTIIAFYKFVKPICLPWNDYTTEEYDGNKLVAIGFGQTENSGFLQSDVLKKVDLPGISIGACKRDYTYATLGFNICAGSVKGKDVCSGDSGGPIIYTENDQSRVVGLTSYGKVNPCGRDGIPGVYASVVGHLEWIAKTISTNK